MQKGIIKTFLIIILAIAFSCSKKIEPKYFLSQIFYVQKLEKLDHNLCVAMKLNVDGKENYQSPHYWNCRLAFAKYRLAVGQLNPIQAQRNIDIGDLVTKISFKVFENSESFVSRETKKIDQRHHKQCLKLGFTFETEDQAKIDEYFFCRKALIEEQQMVPPFGNQDYLKYPNSEYNISYVIDRRVEETIKLIQEKAKEYPTCVGFNIYSENFKRCVEAENNSRQCYGEIDKKRFAKEWEEKIHCQKQAYVRFDDSLIKKRDRKEIEDSRKHDNQFYNQDSFAAIGIDGTLFLSQEKIDEMKKLEEEERKKKALKKTNSKEELYNKYEITKLRYKYIQACRENSNQEIEDYIKSLENSCESLKAFDILGGN